MCATASLERMVKANPVCGFVHSLIKSLTRDHDLTALLRAIDEKLIPGVPENIRVLLVGQTENPADEAHGSSKAGKSVKDETVLERVIKSDTYREDVLHELRGQLVNHWE